MGLSPERVVTVLLSRLKMLRAVGSLMRVFPHHQSQRAFLFFRITYVKTTLFETDLDFQGTCDQEFLLQNLTEYEIPLSF